MRKINRILQVTLLLALLAGCVPMNNSSSPKKSYQSEKPRAAAPQVAAADAQTIAQGNQAFALELYQRLAKPGENFFYSPYSISMAFAMAYAGAQGETARQMADVLHFSLPGDRLHPALNALDQQLLSRKNTPGQGADGKGFRLNVVNDIWGQKDYSFLPAYLDLLASSYGAGLRPMDFAGDPEGARKAINDYIAEKTEQRIKDLIPLGAIDPMMRLVITNAIYFNAAWLYPFTKELTQPAPFTRLDGSTVSVPLMHMPAYESLLYAPGEGYQAVALPYEGGQLSMIILLPDAGTFERFETGLNQEQLNAILGKMQTGSVRVSMPGFKLESEFRLKETLEAMGMKDAFTMRVADFSGMDGTRDLYISEAIHKSFVKVDEAGTEAAAATALMMRAAGMPSSTIDLTVDRPFIFLILDQPTQTILFAGRVLDPAK